ANVVDGVLEAMQVPTGDRKRCKQLIADRNVVALRGYDPRLTEYAMLRGRLEALEKVRPWCVTPVSQIALDRLEQILNRAVNLGIGHRVNIDFAMLRDLEYYTGFVFEGYIEEIGFSLCGGGRYDNLLPRFGYDVPAVGWMGGIERILIALERRGRHVDRKRPRIDLLVAGSDIVAARERAAGNVVRFASADLSDEALIADARVHGIPRILVSRNGTVRELRVRKSAKV
ncbi:MAG: ATP phosphoribosyltransferase regulatory subunit, partial [Vulcanimicrobiaceae bacterium]